MSELAPGVVTRILLAMLLCAAAGARAENTLRGLEMDVMEPGESAAQATSRIVLPPPLAAPEHEGVLDPEQRVRVDGVVAPEMDSLSDVMVDPALGPADGVPVDPGEGLPGGDTSVASPDPGGTITSDTGGN